MRTFGRERCRLTLTSLLLAAEVTITDILDYADKLGTITLLIVILVGGFKRWWVFGWAYQSALARYEKLEDERDAWRTTALNASNVAADAFNDLRRRT